MATKSGEPDLRQLGWLLAWAVVFCDIGTSVYYVPGILFGEVGNLAPAFVALTTVGFVLLAAKYVEVSWRNPEGGGVVTVATKAFSPFMVPSARASPHAPRMAACCRTASGDRSTWCRTRSTGCTNC